MTEPHSELTILARYQLKQLLGERSATRTWLAHDQQTGQMVVLKLLTMGRVKDLKLLEHFEREAKILSELNHPRLPRLIEHFSFDGPEGLELALVSTLMPGQSLLSLLNEGWRPQEQDIREIARQILALLRDLHQREPAVLHRDLKPANILRDPEGQIYLVDFGAAKQMLLRGDSATVTGTFGYLAPEQFYGQALPESDLYALGVTLIHLLSGRHPAELPRDGLNIQYRDYVHAEPDVLDWLDQLIAVDAEARPASAEAALAALEQPGTLISRPLRLPGPSKQLQPFQQAEIQLFALQPGLSSNLLQAILKPVPLLLLTIGLASSLLSVWLGLGLGLLWLSQLILRFSNRLNTQQIWLTPTYLHRHLAADTDLAQINFLNLNLADELKITGRRRQFEGAIPINQIQAVYTLANPLAKLFPKGRFYGIEISCELPLRGFFRLRVASQLTLEEQRWLQQELLSYLLKYQNVKAARQTLLQLRTLKRQQT